MQITIDSDDVQKRKADSRGRVCLGTEYANKAVEVAVLDVEKDNGEVQ